MKEDKSLEQFVESYSRNIRETREKILDDFFRAYISHLMKDGKEIEIRDICLIEYQCDGEHSFKRKYWFEYKPKFPEIENEN